MDTTTQIFVAFIFGVIFISAIVVMALRFPTPTSFQYTIFRVVLALAAAGVAGMLTGFITVTLENKAAGFLISAGGSLAVFIIVYRISPAAITNVQPPPPDPVIPTIRPASIPLPVGTEVVLDTSQHQDQWNGLTAGMRELYPEIRLLDTTLGPETFQSNSPGVLVIPLPYHELFSDSKVSLVKSWVERGGGLLILGYYAADSHHDSNPSRLTSEWGVSFNNDLVMPSGASEEDGKTQALSMNETLGIRIGIDPMPSHDILKNVRTVVMKSAASIKLEPALISPELVLKCPENSTIWEPEGTKLAGGMMPVINKWVEKGTGPALVLAAFTVGRGKVAICGTWKIASLRFGDNRQLMTNLISWLRPT